MANNVAKRAPRQSDRAVRWLTAARLDLNLPPPAAKNWGQINANVNDNHSDPLEISSTFRIRDITDWWRQQEKTHSQYVDLYHVAGDIFCIIPHGVAVEASFSLGWDVIGWQQSKTTGKIIHKNVVVRHFALANNWIFADTDAELHITTSENDSEMKSEPEEMKLHRMAKFHDFWRCGRAAKTNLLPRRNLALKIGKWLPLVTFQTRKRSSKHPGHSFTMIVRLHSNCQKDHLCHQLCLQRTILEDEQKR